MKYSHLQNFLFFFIFINLLLSINNLAFAQKTNYSATDSTTLLNNRTDLLQEKANLEYELLKTKSAVNEQRTYKMLFLAIGCFIFLSAIMITVLFYVKSKKIAELADMQNREILLRDSKTEQLSLILNSVRTPILIAMPSGKIKWINQAFTNLYNINQDYFDDNEMSDFFNDIIEEKEKLMIFDAFEKKANISYEIAGNDENNKIERQITVLLNTSGDITGFAVTDNIL